MSRAVLRGLTHSPSSTDPRHTGCIWEARGSAHVQSSLLFLLPGPWPVASPPHRPHSFLPTPTNRRRGVLTPTSLLCSLCNPLWSVLSEASPRSHHVPPLSPPPLSPQTFLASSGGLYCLGGGCGNVVIPGCMSLPRSPTSSALQLACLGLAAGLHGADALRAPCPEQAPEGPVGGGRRLCVTRVCMDVVGRGALC